jgi:hypothetical protein
MVLVVLMMGYERSAYVKMMKQFRRHARVFGQNKVNRLEHLYSPESHVR